MNKMLKYTIFSTNMGYFGLLTSSEGIVRTSLPMPTKLASKYYLLREIENAKLDLNLMPALQKDITSYFKGSCVDFSGVKISLAAFTVFQIDILTTCRKIAYGQTATYSRLACMAKHPRSARAVGNVMAKNPVPLIIPCHRIIRSDGRLGGFTAPEGIALKRKMLNLESKEK